MNDLEKDDVVLQVTPGFRLLVTSRDRDRVLAEGLGDGKGFDVVMSTARRTRGGRGEHRILESGGAPIRVRPCRRGGRCAAR